jgi:hypothetical protein
MRNSRVIWITVLMLGLLACGFAAYGRKPAVAPSERSAAEEESVSETFQAPQADAITYPNDRGGKLLAELLPPSDPAPTRGLEKLAEQVQFPAPRKLKVLVQPLPASLAGPPRDPVTADRPRSKLPPLPEGSPVAVLAADPVRPEHPDLPAGERVRVPSPRLDAPLPLTTLATPYRETLSSEDATSDYSLAAALATVPFKRSNPAPFLRMTIPEPYENRPAAQLRVEIAESGEPITTSPKPPR